MDKWCNIKSVVSNKTELFHLALVCVGGDIPASRRTCGFLGKILFCAKNLLLMKKYCILSKFYHLSNFIFFKLDLSVTSVSNLERCSILGKNKFCHATMWFIIEIASGMITQYFMVLFLMSRLWLKIEWTRHNSKDKCPSS